MSRKTYSTSNIQKETKLVEQLVKEEMKAYRGNPLLKRSGEVIEMTPEMIEEYQKCMNDPVYFAEQYIKIVHVDRGLIPIKLYDYQKRVIHTLYENRFSIVLSCRQSGKSTMSYVFLLWYILFHEDKRVAILANKAATSRQLLGRMQLAYVHLPKWLQQGIAEGGWNKGSISLENGSSIITAATSSDSIRGESLSCVTGDTKITICDDFLRVWYINIKDVNSSMYTTLNEKDDYMYHFVYKITNLVNNKIYVGFHHTDKLDDGYMGSGVLIKKAIAKYGIENFKKEIIKFFDTDEEALAYERKIVNEEFVNDKNTYNLSIGGKNCIMYGENNGFYGHKHTEEEKKRMVISHAAAYERRKTENVFAWDDVEIDGIIYDSIEKAMKILGLSRKKIERLLLKEGNGYCNGDHTEKLLIIADNMQKAEESKEANIKRFTEFTRQPRTEEHKKHISESSKGKPRSWVSDKINKNPDKIKKMIDKQSGSHWGWNPDLLCQKRFSKDEQLPEGWIKGKLPKKYREAQDGSSNI